MISGFKLYLLSTAGVLVVLAALFILGYYKGKATAQADFDAKLAQLEIEQLEKATQVTSAYSAVLESENEKKQQILDDFAGYRDSYERLRQQVSDSVSNNTSAAVYNAAAVGDLFAECAKEFGEMARKADTHAADAVKLFNAWKAVYGVNQGEILQR